MHLLEDELTSASRVRRAALSAPSGISFVSLAVAILDGDGEMVLPWLSEKRTMFEPCPAAGFVELVARLMVSVLRTSYGKHSRHCGPLHQMHVV